MNTVTHALLPVVLAKTCLGKGLQPRRWQWVMLALAGALPDVINPHIYLESRMTSWSHGLPAWIAFSALIAIACLIKPLKLRPALAVMMSVAYLLHILCDAVSGGVNLLHPFGHYILGDYWVGFGWWIPFDAILVLTCYYFFRFKLLREKASRSRA